MLTILMYHSIDESGSNISVHPDHFASQLAFFAKHRYRMLTIDEVVAALNSDIPIPPRCAALTFDDGYHSVYAVALEHLRRYSFPATLFVTSGYCGRLSNWPSHKPAYSAREMATAAELRELQASGVTIGAHTVNHHHLARLPITQAQREIEDSQDALEQMIGGRVRHFAYPYGELNEALREVVARRFDSACGIEVRLATHGDDIFNLPRLNPYYLDTTLRLGGPESVMGRAYIFMRGKLRVLRRTLTHASDRRH